MKKKVTILKRVMAAVLMATLMVTSSAVPEAEAASTVSAKNGEQLPQGFDPVRAGGLTTKYVSLPKAELSDVRSQSEIIKSSMLGEVGDFAKGSVIYNDDWDQYCTWYYYNEFTAAEKKLYRALYTLCDNYLTGVERTVNQTPNGSGGVYYYLPLVSLEDGEYSVTPKQAARVYFLFRYSNPQFFFTNSILFSDVEELSGDAVGFNSYIGIGVYSTFITDSAIENGKSAILATLQNWDGAISAEESDYAKVLKIHDLIVDRVSYNTGFGTSTFNDEANYSQSVYSALAWSQKKTVCAGYSFAFMMLCNKYGIDCVCLTSSAHQWNAVRVNSRWYAIDLTWDDDPYMDGSVPVWYFFFLRSAKYMDTIENARDGYDENHVEEWFFEDYMPSCTTDSDFDSDSYTTPGTIEKASGTVSAPTFSFDGSKVTLKAASSKALIYYTTDGSKPSVGGCKAFIYKKPFKISKTTVVRAIAVRAGYNDSAAIKISYTLERPVIKSVKSSGGKVTVKWKKESGLSGHEVSITAGGKTKIIRVSGKSKVSKVISNLTIGKKYRIKVRSYIRSGRSMYYSNWSKAKTVRVN